MEERDSEVVFEGEAKIFPKNGLEGFCLVNNKGEELNFEKIAKELYYNPNKSYSFNTTIRYKIIIDRLNK